MSIRTRTIAALAFLIGVAGCSASTPAPSAGGGVDATGDWQLTSGVMDGAPFPVVPDAPITLTVTGTQIGGRSACNHYGGEIVVENGNVRLRVSSMTEMACLEPAMAAEAAFHAAIGRIAGATRAGDRLILSGPDVELTFDRMAAVPIAELVGTDWVLESLISGDVVSSVAGEAATLRLEPGGTFAGSTGCRRFRGRWVTANGGIAPTDFGMEGTECPASLADQDGHIAAVLGGFRASVDGRMLTLTGDGGDGLVYRTAD